MLLVTHLMLRAGHLVDRRRGCFRGSGVLRSSRQPSSPASLHVTRLDPITPLDPTLLSSCGGSGLPGSVSMARKALEKERAKCSVPGRCPKQRFLEAISCFVSIFKSRGCSLETQTHWDQPWRGGDCCPHRPPPPHPPGPSHVKKQEMT